MSDKRTFILAHAQARSGAIEFIRQAPEGWTVSVAPPTRTTEQNSLLWALLTDLSKQVDWYGSKLTKEEWKDCMTAALKREKVVPGINGGFVVLGQHTSSMSKKALIELIELIQAFGAEKGVKWTG